MRPATSTATVCSSPPVLQERGGLLSGGAVSPVSEVAFHDAVEVYRVLTAELVNQDALLVVDGNLVDHVDDALGGGGRMRLLSASASGCCRSAP